MRTLLLGFSVLSVVAVAACNDPGRGPMQQGAYAQPNYAQPIAPQSAAMGATNSTTAVTTTTTTTPSPTRDPFVGMWSGTLPSGAAVQIAIPASGVTPTYYFRGESQPMGATEMRGQTMRAYFVPSGNGYIELTPQADGRMIYFFNSNQTTANLVMARS
ncbi:MAG: hypothetical protein ACOVVK_03265 [Elsteraceae bacterium]